MSIQTFMDGREGRQLGGHHMWCPYRHHRTDYQNGVLLVELPKEKAPEKAKALKIEIGDRQQKISDGE